MKLASKFAFLCLLSMCATLIVSCGTEERTNARTEIPKKGGDQHKHDDHHHDNDDHHDHDDHGHDHHGHAHDIVLKNKICTIVKSEMSDFEVVCPVNIETIRYNGMQTGKLSLKGKNMTLVIEKTADDRVAGSTTKHHIKIELLLADGKVEVIQVP